MGMFVGRDGFQGVIKVARYPQPTADECVRIRDRLILALSGQRYGSRVIGTVLNIDPVSVRRIRTRVKSKANAMKEQLNDGTSLGMG